MAVLTFYKLYPREKIFQLKRNWAETTRQLAPPSLRVSRAHLSASSPTHLHSSRSHLPCTVPLGASAVGAQQHATEVSVEATRPPLSSVPGYKRGASSQLPSFSPFLIKIHWERFVPPLTHPSGKRRCCCASVWARSTTTASHPHGLSWQVFGAGEPHRWRNSKVTATTSLHSSERHAVRAKHVFSPVCPLPHLPLVLLQLQMGTGPPPTGGAT
jgi:hypothetical protein